MTTDSYGNEMPYATDQIATALCKAQQAITNPPRNREVAVKTKTGGTYKFRYATLDAIIDHVRQPLTENGLWFTQTLANGDGKYKLVTTLLHASGQTLSSETPLLVQGAGNQEFGSALTYMRRYALTAMLGIAADEDDDGNHSDGNTVTSQKDTPKGKTNGAGETSGGSPRTPDAAAPDQGAGPTLPPKDSRDPKWKGPLTKTDLQANLKAFFDAIGAAQTLEEIDALEDEYRAVTDQAKHDTPGWLDGSNMPPEFVPGNRRLEARRNFINGMQQQKGKAA